MDRGECVGVSVCVCERNFCSAVCYSALGVFIGEFVGLEGKDLLKRIRSRLRAERSYLF